jgi:hypothetical protein
MTEVAWVLERLQRAMMMVLGTHMVVYRRTRVMAGL